ncbi:uncharacterized protein [Arachis hypogaea]|uniref:uncharacterized protein n=1 Tax=Arachis hypogaea TaxID=3818 RepID=UPI003B211CDE
MIRNTALLFKWWWRFAKEECPLWKKVVCSCNNLRLNELLSTQVFPTRGGPWKDICHIEFKEQTLRDKIITGLAMEVLQEGMLSEDVARYSFRNTIWKGLAPPRVELFVWFVLVGKVNTKERLSRLRIISQDDKRCVLCNKDDEQVHHLFLDCDFAWHVWSAWISAFGRPCVFPELVKDHFLSWTDESRRKEDRKQRLRCFCAIIWHIWMERNRRIFQNEVKALTRSSQ